MREGGKEDEEEQEEENQEEEEKEEDDRQGGSIEVRSVLCHFRLPESAFGPNVHALLGTLNLTEAVCVVPCPVLGLWRSLRTVIQISAALLVLSRRCRGGAVGCVRGLCPVCLFDLVADFVFAAIPTNALAEACLRRPLQKCRHPEEGAFLGVALCVCKHSIRSHPFRKKGPPSRRQRALTPNPCVFHVLQGGDRASGRGPGGSWEAH